MKTSIGLPAVITERQHRLPLAAILLLALAVRVALFVVAWHHSLDLAALHDADSASYLEPAESLLHGEFSRHGAPELLRTPGYPLLLSFGLALGQVEVVNFVLQTLLGLVTITVIYRLAWSLTASRRAAIAAGLLMAVEPLSLIYNSYLMTETSFTCVLVLMVAALASYDRTSSFGRLTIAALLLAAASLVRPITYFLPPVIAVALLARAVWRREPHWRCALAPLVFLAGSFGPTAAWQARNWAAADYTGFSAISALNLYFHQGASVVAALEHQSLTDAQADMGHFSVDFISDAFYQLHPETRGAGQAAAFRCMQREGSRLVHEHLLTYAKIHLRGMVMLMLNPGAPDLLLLLNHLPQDQVRKHPIDAGILAILRQMHREAPLVLYVNLLLSVGLGLTYLAAAFGLLKSLGRWNWSLTFLVLVAGYLVTIAGGPTGIARLRHPIMPLVCVLAGIGVASLSCRRTKPEPESAGQLIQLRIRTAKSATIPERRTGPEPRIWQPAAADPHECLVCSGHQPTSDKVTLSLPVTSVN